MKAMILAAGLGSRMRPLTNSRPKPLLEVGGKPLIVWHIERLREAGFREIVINVAYLGEQIIDYLGDGSSFGITIEFSDEQDEGALETAGGILKALPKLSETFLVVNGDVWCDYQFSPKVTLSDEKLAKLILVPNPDHNPKGDFYLHNTNDKYTFSGIAYYSKKFFENLKQGKQSLVPLLFEGIKQNKIDTALHEGDWYDIGTPKRLKKLNNKIKYI